MNINCPSSDDGLTANQIDRLLCERYKIAVELHTAMVIAPIAGTPTAAREEQRAKIEKIETAIRNFRGCFRECLEIIQGA
jgi:hypothetical protein